MTSDPEGLGSDKPRADAGGSGAEEIRVEAERFMNLMRRHPELRAELESLVPPSAPGFAKRSVESDAVLPNIEPFGGLPVLRFVLLEFMRHWSEELRAAQWYGELEFFLTTVGPGTTVTPGIPPPGFQAAYRELIERAGGWFTYGPEGPEFVPGTYDELLIGVAHWAGTYGS